MTMAHLQPLITCTTVGVHGVDHQPSHWCLVRGPGPVRASSFILQHCPNWVQRHAGGDLTSWRAGVRFKAERANYEKRNYYHRHGFNGWRRRGLGAIPACGAGPNSTPGSVCGPSPLLWGPASLLCSPGPVSAASSVWIFFPARRGPLFQSGSRSDYLPEWRA